MKWPLTILFLACAAIAGAAILPYGVITTNAVNEFTLDLGATQTVDGVFSTETNYTFTPSWASTSGAGTNPLGVIMVYVGNSNPATTYAGQQWVPYDACFVNGQFNSGSVIESQESIRFSPMQGRYVTLQLQTNQNWTATNGSFVIAPPPTNLQWDCYTNFVHGCVGTSFGLVDAVVAATNSVNGSLLQDGYDLSYYLTELEGAPVPIILPSQTNLYSGVIYRVVDLQSNAPSYATQEANIANGTLPTNITVNIQGTREVDFTGWPYQTVYEGVITFLEKQGVRWVYPDENGDYIPYGAGVSLSSLPYNFQPTTKSIYANFSIDAFYPWPSGVIGRPVRQGYLYWIRNHFTSSESALHFVGGSEIQYESAPGGLNGNYSEEFSGYPHNFNVAVPSRIMELAPGSANSVAVDTNWWGFQGGVNVNPLTGVYDGNPYLTWSQTSSNLIKWAAQKVIAVDTAYPLDSVNPLTYKAWSRYYGLLPIDATAWSTNAQEVALDTPWQPAGDGWVNASGAYSYSPQYYYMLTNVAYDVAQQGGSQNIMGLAYANVNAAPPNFAKFPANLHVQVCLYGQPVLPTASSQNQSISNNWVKWNNLTTNLGCYGYDLLLVDFSQQDPRMMIPEVSGLVDREKFLENEGVNEAGCQAFAGSGSSYGMAIYNPWDFYAYPRTWWNKTNTAVNVLSEFFTGYYQESATPMLNFYNAFEQSLITNNVGMHMAGYAENIAPGTFTFPVLYVMQTDLALAYTECTNWTTYQRLNVISNQFAWTINQLNLGGTNLNNPGQFAGVPTNSILIVPATKLFPNPGIPGAGFATNEEANSASASTGVNGTNTWVLGGQYGSVQATLNFTNSGYYSAVVYGGYNYEQGGACRITVGTSSGSLPFTNNANSTVAAYTNVIFVPSGANTVMIDSFNTTNNSSLPGEIYAVTFQYLSNSPSMLLNVTNFGAVGDETNLLANTVSNMTSFTSSWVLPQSYVGESCELFGCGQWHYGLTSGGTNGYGQEDLTTSIAAISGTTVTVANTISNTLTAAYCIVGTNNSPAIQACINAAGPNFIIQIPNAPFLCLSASNRIDSWYNPTNFNHDSNDKRDIYYSLVITNGALQFTNLGPFSRLVAQGAWRDVVTTVSSNGTPYYFTNVQRGALIAEMGPLGWNGNVTFSGVTLDGGVQKGFTGHCTPPANIVDGDGWDETSDAVWAIGGYNPSTGYYPMWSSMTFINCTNQNFRGEMLKTTDNSSNGVAYIISDSFLNGNATGINWQEAGYATNCYFQNLYGAFEMGQSTIFSPWTFTGCLATNIHASCCVIEIGMGTAAEPLFQITGSAFWLDGYFGNQYWLGLPSADNVLANSNTVHFTGYSQAVDAGNISGQASNGTTNNTVANNTFFYPTYLGLVNGGTNASDTPHNVYNLAINNNTVIETNQSIIHQQYGWTTRVSYSGNTYPSNNLATVNPDPNGAPYTNYAYIDIGNGYWSPINDITDAVISLSYAHGGRYQVQSAQSGARVVLINSDSNNIPGNPQSQINNQNIAPLLVSMNTASGTTAVAPVGSTVLSSFTNNFWFTTIPANIFNIGVFQVGQTLP